MIRNPPILVSFALFVSLNALAGINVNAQESPVAERQVRFLAVGEMPPYRQEIRNGIRYELEPTAGSIPPREVQLGFGDDTSAAVPIRLGRISAPLKAPPGAGPLILRRPADKEDSEPWLRVQRPETDDFLVLLWRAAAKGTWEAASSLVLPEGPLAAPAGSIRVVNLLPAEVRVVLGEQRILLGAGKTTTHRMPFGVEQPFQILLPDASGTLKILHSGVSLLNPGERGLALIYRADGVSPRRPVKVTVQREPAPAPPPVRE
jgi:hypothetical protein